jgi:hypothetical protein
MIKNINNWIDKTLENYSHQTVSCIKFSSQFRGFYAEKFLENSFYVVVEKVPKPKLPILLKVVFNMVEKVNM